MTDKNKIIDYTDGSEDLRGDLDFIRGSFEEDGLPIPESVSEDAVRSMLDQAGPQTRATSEAPAGSEAPVTADASARSGAGSSGSPDAPARKRHWRAIISVAACAALVIGLIPFLHSVLPGGSSDRADMAAGENGLVAFESYQDLEHELGQIMSDREDAPYGLGHNLALDSEAGAEKNEAIADSDMAMSAAESSSDYSSPDGNDHSQTYNQVEGIDEADIVKTDDRYIYYLSTAENNIIIAEANKGKAKRVSTVNGSVSGYVFDLFVRGDQLIVIAWDSEGQSDGLNKGRIDTNVTAVTVYDISDRTDPRQINRYTQSGMYLSSRLIGDHVCLVTNQWVDSQLPEESIPQVSYSATGLQDLPIGDICSFPKITSPTFTVVGLLDLSAGTLSKDTVKTKAILGCSDEIYCNGENLYVTGSIPSRGAYVLGSGYEDADSEKNADTADTDVEEIYLPEFSMDWKTQVLKVSLSKGKVRCQATAIVDGSVNDQFSLDEKDGILRIATTSDVDGTDVNNLFLLDEKMRELGSCRGFARDEHIEAVRYIKDKAYVITYEETDPLFIIDLSDPANPVIEGHVKISGFSTLLVPCDQDHMLGLGFSTETTEFGEATDGVKLALFDISDPSAPAVADSKEFPDMYSPVQYEHKALLVGPDASYYAIPYERYSDDWLEDDIAIAEREGSAEEDSAEADGNYGILVFRAKAGKLETLQDLETRGTVSRCVWIGDYIYGICDDDTIEGFRLK